MRKLLILTLLLSVSCSKKAEPVAAAPACSTLTGTAWTPDVSGVSTSNHDTTNVSISTTTATTTGPVSGLEQGISSRLLTVTFSVPDDLGDNGSLTLEAETTSFPADLAGSAYPVLMSLNDGTNELVNADISSTGGGCGQSGFQTCTGSNCSAENAACTVASPSAYASGDVWRYHQIQNYGYVSVNTFPTCNYAQTGATNFPACAFNSTFFSSGKLRTGVTYTAKYVLLADRYKTLSGYTAGLSVKVTRKKDAQTALGGAIDLNVILVGNKNINASRTDKGKQNLNLLFGAVRDILADSRVNVTIGKISAIEWNCDNGGDAYADVSDEDLGDLFAAGSARVSSSSEGKAINIFIVSSIPYASGESNLTIAGSSSSILGPLRNGLASSGIAIASNEELDTMNPDCTLTNCPATAQERDFLDMQRTYVHEMGHYLGLFHPGESGGTTHDPIWDTPICTATQTVSGSDYITIGACLNSDTNQNPAENAADLTAPSTQTCGDACTSYDSATGLFCPTAFECQFNHLMWWTSQNFKNGSGDGAIISPHSSRVINYNALVQ